MCIGGAKVPFTPQVPQQPDQGQVNQQIQRMSTNNLGIASTILTSPVGVQAAAPTTTKTLIGS